MRRPPADVSPPRRPRRSSRSRVGLAVAAVVLFVLVTSMRGIAGFYTDYLWFDDLGYSSVWRGVLGVKVGLAVVFTLLAFVAMWASLTIADRVAPRFRPMGPEDEIVARYQEVVGPHSGRVRLAVAVLFALIAGSGMASQWRSWILFRNAVDFDAVDPLFRRDIGFYVFRLPFLASVVDWLFVSLVLVLVLTVVAHYLNGGIRLQSPIQRVSPQVKAHVSVLLALLALAKAAAYWLQRFELTVSGNGYVDGAGYTDVKARLPALNLLVLIMLAAAVLFLVNIWRRGWALPVIAVIVWGVVALVAGAIAPAFVQNVQVKPAENEREQTYIRRNIEATRAAMNIGDDVVETTPFPYTAALTGDDLGANAESIRNVRLWDPDAVRDTFRGLQEFRRFYEFNDVDIDRYTLDGEARQVILSVRGLNPDDIPGNSWVNRHLQYTHGYGAVLAPANSVNAQGRPSFLLSGIPPDGTPEITQPRIYFSEELPGYAIVNTKQAELDPRSEDEEGEAAVRYQGDAGVRLSSFVRRAAMALRFADGNLLLSSQVTAESRVIFNRDIHTRVRSLAPFLAFDSDPYAVIVDGRIYWMLDAYTTTDRYPYAEKARTDGLRAGADLDDVGFNYVRNSVKVTIDAYSGETTFYLWDDTDPLARSYAKAFPDLFRSGDELPNAIRDHVRYPEDLFRVQANMFGEYHVTDADTFYAGTEAWDIAQDPGTGRVSEALQRTAPTTPGPVGGQGVPTAEPARTARMEPTYLLIRLPGEERPSFLILQPFVPASRGDQQVLLTAFLTAKSDRGEYGEMRAFVMPAGQQVDGPVIVNNAIQATPAIATELTQLDQRGSKALFGQVQVIPIENSLLYVRPLYVTSESRNLPEVKYVIVVHNGKAVMRPTLRESLIALFGSAPETLEEGPTTPPTEPTEPTEPTPPAGDVQALLDQAAALLEQANADLRATGDLGAYQQKVNEAARLIEQARAAAGTTTTTAPTTTTTAPSSA